MYSNQQTLGQRQDWGNKNKMGKLFLPAAVSVKRSHSHLVIINYKYSIHDKASAGAPTG